MSDPYSLWRRAASLFKKILSKSQNPPPKNLAEILDEAYASGVIDCEEQKMMSSVASLNDKIVKDVMVSRTQVVFCSAETSLLDVHKQLRQSGHSRVPVFLAEQDNVVGVLYAKDLLAYWGRDVGRFRVADVMRRPFFVPELKRAVDLMHEFQASRTHMAVVVDEYGGVSGIVTIEDIVEEVVGEIHDEFDKPGPGVKSRTDGAVETDSLVEVSVIEDHFGVQIPRKGAETICGLLFELFGEMPVGGDEIESCGLLFRVIDTHKMRIGRVEISKNPVEEAPS